MSRPTTRSVTRAAVKASPEAALPPMEQPDAKVKHEAGNGSGLSSPRRAHSEPASQASEMADDLPHTVPDDPRPPVCLRLRIPARATAPVEVQAAEPIAIRVAKPVAKPARRAELPSRVTKRRIQPKIMLKLSPTKIVCIQKGITLVGHTSLPARIPERAVVTRRSSRLAERRRRHIARVIFGGYENGA